MDALKKKRIDIVFSAIIFLGSLVIIGTHINNNNITGNATMDFSGNSSFLLTLFVFLSVAIIGYIIYIYKNP